MTKRVLFEVAGAFVSIAILSGCASSGVRNPSGIGVTEMRADEKGFVAGTHEYAFRYGGRSDFTRGSEIEPGVDCPHGNTVHFANDTNTKIAVTRQKFRRQFTVIFRSQHRKEPFRGSLLKSTTLRTTTASTSCTRSSAS